MLFDLVVFVAFVSFFLVKDLVDGGGVGLWLFPIPFFTGSLLIFLFLDVSLFYVVIIAVLTSFWHAVSVVVVELKI
jgi:hypothetical protein